MPPVDGHGVGVDKAGPTGDDLEPVGLHEVGVLLLAQGGDQVVLLGHEGGQVHRASRRGDASEGVVAGRPVGLPGPQQRLGGNAADVHARAPEGARLDQGHPVARLGALDGCREGRRSGPEYQQVIVDPSVAGRNLMPWLFHPQRPGPVPGRGDGVAKGRLAHRLLPAEPGDTPTPVGRDVGGAGSLERPAHVALTGVTGHPGDLEDGPVVEGSHG